MNGPKIPNMNMSLDIDNCETIVCQCGSMVWENCFIVKRVSPLQSPDGKEAFVNIPTVICKKCGNDIRLAIDSMKNRVVN